MSRRAASAALLLLLAVAPGAAAAEGAAPLTVCLEENVPLLSLRRGGEGSGLDLEVARRVAGMLGRPLAVQWFGTEADPDSSPVRQVNALLSDGRCDLVGGYPLAERTLGKPFSGRGRLPDFAGARPEDRRRWVPLGTLAPTRPYRRNAIGLMVGPGFAGPEPQRLAELQGRRLGAEDGTLADAILTAYRDGLLAGGITHVPAGTALFEHLERGDFDAALVETHRFDSWRAGHPGTPLRLTAYRHRVGFNVGFVGLSAAAPLLAEVGGALDQLRQEGSLPRLAEAAGVTYAEPLPPEIGGVIPPATLRDD